MYEGSCLCGSIQYQLEREPFDCCYCHCSICRKLTGSGHGAYGSVRRDDFAWSKTAQRLSKYSPTELSTRYFCSNCGSYLLTEHKAEPENLFVALGSLDTPIAATPEYRQFVNNTPAWSKASDDLPAHAGWPGAS